MNILELKNVSYSYPATRKNVLQNVNAAFEKGKLYSIMGKSGAGKSTVLSLISGLDICTEGEILYNGENLKMMDRDNYRAKKIGVIFQSYNLLTNATAIENIELSMNISGCKPDGIKNHAYNLLENVGIDKETANRKVLKLSGGEQQRVGIARAISHKPDIVIADEPTGNLDNETRKTIMDTLTVLAHEEDKCVIIVTHSRKVASGADELWGLNAGRLSFIKER